MKIIIKNEKKDLYMGLSNYFFHDLHENNGKFLAQYKCYGETAASGICGEVLIGYSSADAEEKLKKYFSDEYFVREFEIEVIIFPWSGITMSDYGVIEE